ncbi:MAG: hypothetical protein ACK4UR_02290 [Caldimicrobium sp.]
MKEKDTLLTVKDWINSFWEFQEEDIKFLTEEIKEKIKDPKNFLIELKQRMQTRKTFYNLFKHLSLRDVSLEEFPWVEKKLEEILEREKLISVTVDNILDIISTFYSEENLTEVREKLLLISEDKLTLH